MSLGGFRWGESQYFHRFVIQDENRLVDRVVCGRWWATAGETGSTYGVGLGIIEGIGESCSPGMCGITHCFIVKQDELALDSPMTKIARDNTKRVLHCEERRNNFAELGFHFAIYRTNKDGNDGYIQPTRMVGFRQFPRNRILTLRTSYARKAGAFLCYVHLRRSVYPYH